MAEQSTLTWGILTPANAVAVAQLLAAFITALATIALWHVTRTLAVETKTLSSMSSRPFVTASFRSNLAAATALDLAISNTGNAPAFDIHVVITPPLPRPNGSRNADTSGSIFAVSLLQPGFSLPREGVLGRDVHDESFDVVVSWSDYPRSSKREELAYSMTVNDGFKDGWGVKGQHHIAEELEKIRKLCLGDRMIRYTIEDRCT